MDYLTFCKVATEQESPEEARRTDNVLRLGLDTGLGTLGAFGGSRLGGNLFNRLYGSLGGRTGQFEIPKNFHAKKNPLGRLLSRSFWKSDYGKNQFQGMRKPGRGWSGAKKAIYSPRMAGKLGPTAWKIGGGVAGGAAGIGLGEAINKLLSASKWNSMSRVNSGI